MNIVLFEPAETRAPLPATDPRARHVRKVLRRQVGDTLDAGLVNGPRGTARITAADDAGLQLDFTWQPPHSPPPPTTLVVGFPRPQTARDILRDAATLGVTALHFVSTTRSDPNYRTSSLWRDGAWRQHVLAGVAQAFDTHVPTVTWDQSLADLCGDSGLPPTRVALDIYEASAPLSSWAPTAPDAPVAIFIGPERGWENADRDLLRAAQPDLHSLGHRVLRTEAAVIAALSLIGAARDRVRK